jgi:hypothetical protein
MILTGKLAALLFACHQTGKQSSNTQSAGQVGNQSFFDPNRAYYQAQLMKEIGGGQNANPDTLTQQNNPVGGTHVAGGGGYNPSPFAGGQSFQNSFNARFPQAGSGVAGDNPLLEAGGFNNAFQGTGGNNPLDWYAGGPGGAKNQQPY